MTPEQLREVLSSIGNLADGSALQRNGFESTSTYEITLRSNRMVPIQGRSDEEAVQQVVNQIKALATRFEEIGV